MSVYRIIGTLHPAMPVRSQVSMEATANGDRQIAVKCILQQSELIATINTQGDWTVGDIRGTVQEFVETALCGYCLTSARAIHFNLNQIESDEGQVIAKFEYGLAIEPMSLEDATRMQQNRMGLMNDDHGFLIRRCIASLRLAALHPIEAMFLYHRAVESLVKHYGQVAGIKNDGNLWAKFQSLVHISKSDCDRLSKEGGEVRHGGFSEVTAEKSNASFHIAMSAILEYLNWYSQRIAVKS